MPVHYLSRLATPKQESFKLGTAANTGKRPTVLAADIVSGTIVKEPLVKLYSTGSGIRDWIQIKVAAKGGSGYRYLNCAPGTVLATPSGKTHMADLREGDLVLGAVCDFMFSDAQMELIRGTCLGDGSVKQVSLSKATLRLGHGEAQKAYMKWKHKSLAPYVGAVRRVGRGFGFDSLACSQLLILRAHLYDYDNHRIVTEEYLSQLTPASLAAWFLDDGTTTEGRSAAGNGKSELCNTAVRQPDHRELIAEHLERVCGARPTVGSRGFLFSGERNKLFQSTIAPYVHPSMQYKIVPKFRQPFIWDIPTLKKKPEKQLMLTPLEIIGIQPMAKNRMFKGFSFKTQSNNPLLLDFIAVYGGE